VPPVQCSPGPYCVQGVSVADELYRVNVQLKWPYPENPSGYYYASAVHYAKVPDLTALDIAIDTIFEAEWRAHNNSVSFDWQNIVNLTTGVTYRNTYITWPPFTWQPGDPAGLLNTVYIGFTASGAQAGYKRVRPPLRASDMVGDRLTDAAIAYYSSSYAEILLSSGYACNYQGTVFDGYRVWPKVSGWQLRHGTKRREVRRYHS